MRKIPIVALILIILVMAMQVVAQSQTPQQTQKELLNPQIDFGGFLTESKEAYEYRKDRRVSIEEFIDMAKDENTIILDTRSKDKYKMKHVKGAVHLNFSDFTEDALTEVIPSRDTRILIYCNNNFLTDKNDKVSIDTKAFPAKYEPYALNIPTFINLYGYGYKNIYELKPAVKIEETKLEFESL